MLFWSSLDNFLFKNKIHIFFFFQKGVDNFELEHKMCLFLVRGVVPLHVTFCNYENLKVVRVVM